MSGCCGNIYLTAALTLVGMAVPWVVEQVAYYPKGSVHWLFQSTSCSLMMMMMIREYRKV